MSFLPNDYKIPQGKSNYMKFEDGVNKFRILSSPIIGWEYWNEDSQGNRKPIRKRMTDNLVMADIQEPDKVKHFWAMVVWNYADEQIQILEVTQKGLQKSLKALSSDEDWGSPINKYDIQVTRSGEKLLTKYELQPKPAKVTDKKITEEFNKIKINLEALFDGADPFKVEGETVNPKDIPF